MIKSMSYVIKENLSNLYRIYSIAKYEMLGDIRDSRFGVFWNFASPAIQIFTYWLVFGLAWGRNDVLDHHIRVSYLPWLVVGYAVWSYMRSCLSEGCSAIFSKVNVITKMKFPVSVLPASVCLKNFFDHLFMFVIMVVTLILCGHLPVLNWLWILYYMVAAFLMAEALAMVLSILTMLWRDVKKLINSTLRMLMYFSPMLWNCHFSSHIPFHQVLNVLVKLNPIYYIINGYRDAIFYGRQPMDHPALTLYFWGLFLVLFGVGCVLMKKFKTQFIDMI